MTAHPVPTTGPHRYSHIESAKHWAQKEADRTGEPWAVVECGGMAEIRPKHRALSRVSKDKAARIVAEVEPEEGA
jgi:hypothetical protein